MKKAFTYFVILLCVLPFSKKVAGQKALREISIHAGLGIPPKAHNFLYWNATAGISLGTSVLFPMGHRFHAGLQFNSALLRSYPFLFHDMLPVNMWMHSFDGKAKFKVVALDSVWSISINAQTGVTFIDALKNKVDSSEFLIFSLNNKYGFNIGGGMNLNLTISYKIRASMYVNYCFIKILTDDKNFVNEQKYDSHLIYPGVEVTYLF